jgi:beta-lactamase class D
MKARYALLPALTIGCARPPAPTRAAEPPPLREVIDEGLSQLFRQSSVDGAFVLFDARRSLTTVVNPAFASRGFLPASTFKIPNTLIGLETGVISDERFSLRWDGVRRARSEWNRDHDLPSAMKHSVVWFYQEVARRVGQARMEHWVDALGYGNRDISGGIDLFWLEGGLRISPRQQVDFIWRLHSGKLPAVREHVELVERLITLEARNGIVLRGKTGMGSSDENTLGWFVGSVSRGDDAAKSPAGDEFFAYATVLIAPGPDAERVRPLRESLSRKLLARSGALPAEWAP